MSVEMLKKLYEREGFKFDRIVELSDGYRDVRMIIYVREHYQE